MPSSSLDGLAPPDQALLQPHVAALRAAALAHLGRTPSVAALPGSLVAAPAALVDRAAEVLLRSCCAAAWRLGWLPGELLHQTARAPLAVGRLVAAAIAADHVDRRSTTLHPRWVAHVESLELPAADGRAGWVGRWAATQPDRPRALVAMVHAVSRVVLLGPLDALLPPPGGDDTVVAPSWYLLDDPSGAADPVLQRIRVLLAKAESTTYEAEAEAFTAKAQALMTKHAVDAALVGRAGPGGARAVAMRLCIDAPYVAARSTLLHVVAEASRCRVVQHPTFALATVVGHPADLRAVEVLYTSLLVQAQAALDDALRRAGPRSASGSKVFRSSFLTAYAGRIGQRLAEVAQAVVAEATATHGAALVPVLAARTDAADAYVREHFAQLRTLRPRRRFDAEAVASGRIAADRARLTHGEVG